MKIFIIFILASSSVFAGKSQFIDFFDSLENRFMMRTDHLIDLSERIKLKKIGIFGNRNAEATYTPFTNTISLKKEYMVKIGRQYRVKDYGEFLGENGVNYFSVRASTIFHELAHADFDVFMEKDKQHPMNKLLMRELPAWFKRHKAGVNAQTATHELFGYTAGDFILTMEYRMQDILMAHGLYPNKNKCFPKKALLKIAQRLGLKERLIFKDVLSSDNFKERIVPKVIFINGKDIDVKDLPDRFKRRLVNYFARTYDLSVNSTDLIERLNKSDFLNRLKKCYSEVL